MQKPRFDQATKIWHGNITPYPFGEKGIAQIAYENMKANLNHVCQISDDSGEIYNYERTLKAAVSLAHNLQQKYGIRQGDRAILFMEHHHYLLPTYYGCVLAGMVICPFAFTHDVVKEEIAPLISQINPSILISSEERNLDIFKEIFSDLKLKVPIISYKNQSKEDDELKSLLESEINIDDFPLPQINDPNKELFALTMSSSTTGKTKLINITHRQILMFMVDGLSNIRMSILMRPGWHSNTISVFWILINNLTAVIRAHYTIEQFLLMLDKHKVNVAFVKPKDIFVAIKSSTIKQVSLDTVKLISSSGEHLSAKLAEELQSYLKNGIVKSMYGMTDVGGVLTSNVLDPSASGSVGKVGQNVQLKIIKENGEPLGPNEIGEICGKFIYADFSGYHKNETLTKQSMDADGFFKTEDIGYIDENGNLFLVERKKFLISYRGEWINQSTIEKAVLDNIEGCAGVCAVNVEDETHGEIPIVAVIPEKDAELNEQEILKVVQASHNFPFETKVMFFDKLPMTISSKFRKHLVRDMIVERSK